jgi:hypothetical protein
MRKNPDAAVILAGDLNDHADSKTLTILRGTLGSYPLTVLPAVGPESKDFTWHREGGRFPPARFDYLLVSPSLAERCVRGSAVVYRAEGTEIASDHNPVLARFEVRPLPVAGRMKRMSVPLWSRWLVGGLGWVLVVYFIAVVRDKGRQPNVSSRLLLVWLPLQVVSGVGIVLSLAWGYVLGLVAAALLFSSTFMNLSAEPRLARGSLLAVGYALLLGVHTGLALLCTRSA